MGGRGTYSRLENQYGGEIEGGRYERREGVWRGDKMRKGGIGREGGRKVWSHR